MKEALLYERLQDGRVRCQLCAHGCMISQDKVGICGVRQNRDGTLYSLVYGQLISQAIDPIEKKPLFHFHPGSTSFSIATVGCNFRCSFCQNYSISQMPRDQGMIQGHATAAETVVEAAKRHACASISYTYTEPTVAFEYTLDVSRLAHASGLANVYVSNGYMSRGMLDYVTSTDAKPLLDAANIDLKSFRDEFYRHECGATLKPVLDSLVLMKQRGVWVEVTTLVIPGPQRLGSGVARHRALYCARDGRGYALACEPFSPHVPSDRPPRHADGHREPCARDRPGRGLAICLRGQRTRRQRREHHLPLLRQDCR